MGKIKAEHLIVKVTAIGVGRRSLDTAHLSLAQAADRSAEVMLHKWLFSEVL